LLRLLILLICGCSQPSSSPRSAANEGDAAFARLADGYIAGYLAWRPQTGTALGFHEYDGKVTDYSPPSLNAELARLRSFDQRLAEFHTNLLSQQGFYDYRILRSADAGGADQGGQVSAGANG
jgi:uncharacterized protein (DUF885 family)